MSTVIESRNKTSAPGAAILSQDQIQTKLSDAITQFVFKNPGKTKEQLQVFEAQVLFNIKKSAANRTNLNERQYRDARKKALNKKADDLNIKFVQVRNTVLVRNLTRALQEVPRSSGLYNDLLAIEQVLPEDMYIVVEDESYQVQNYGGATIAYYFETYADNDLFANYAVATCRSDEKFDGLLGREIALERLLKGWTIGEPILHRGLTTNKFTDEQKQRLVRSYNRLFFPDTDGIPGGNHPAGLSINPAS